MDYHMDRRYIGTMMMMMMMGLEMRGHLAVDDCSEILLIPP